MSILLDYYLYIVIQGWHKNHNESYTDFRQWNFTSVTCRNSATQSVCKQDGIYMESVS